MQRRRSVSLNLNTNPNPIPNTNPKRYTIIITEFFGGFQQISMYIGAVVYR